MEKKEKIEKLIDLGFTEIESKSMKFRTFKYPELKISYQNDADCVFIGRNGAMRLGRSVSNSISRTKNPEKFFNWIENVKK